MAGNYNRGDTIINVVDGRSYRLFERYGTSPHHYFASYGVFDAKGSFKIIKRRHIRPAMRGEVLAFERSKLENS